MKKINLRKNINFEAKAFRKVNLANHIWSDVNFKLNPIVVLFCLQRELFVDGKLPLLLGFAFLYWEKLIFSEILALILTVVENISYIESVTHLFCWSDFPRRLTTSLTDGVWDTRLLFNDKSNRII